MVGTKEYGDFVDKLRKARIEADLQQIDVAKKLKRAQSYVSSVGSASKGCDLYKKDIKYCL